MADCSHPSAPGDEELLRYALEEYPLPPEKQAHLEQCAACQQRLAEYTRLNDALVGRFYRRSCPSGIQISLYCEGLLADDERISIANHILECPLCAAEATFTRRFMQDAPAVAETGFSPLSSLQRVVGVLTKKQAQLVTRGDETAWPRQYRADGVDLSLHLSRASSGERMLLGILSSVDSVKSVDVFEGAAVELQAGSFPGNIEQEMFEGHIQRVLVDDLGNFVFHAVQSGDYILLIHLPEQDVVIEQITIE